MVDQSGMTRLQGQPSPGFHDRPVSEPEDEPDRRCLVKHRKIEG